MKYFSAKGLIFLGMKVNQKFDLVKFDTFLQRAPARNI